MSFVQPFRDYIDSLIHPSVQQDPLTATRHRAFIAPRLLGSLIALVSFAFVAFYLLFFERERRRFYGGNVAEDDAEDETASSEAVVV